MGKHSEAHKRQLREHPEEFMPCWACRGTGMGDYPESDCFNCYGTGMEAIDFSGYEMAQVLAPDSQTAYFRGLGLSWDQFEASDVDRDWPAW